MHIQSTKEKNKEKTKNFKIQTDLKSIVIRFSEKMEKKNHLRISSSTATASGRRKRGRSGGKLKYKKNGGSSYIY